MALALTGTLSSDAPLGFSVSWCHQCYAPQCLLLSKISSPVVDSWSKALGSELIISLKPKLLVKPANAGFS